MNQEISSSEIDFPEVNFYYPNQFWQRGGGSKNLIWFFDGVGLLVPEYMQDRLESV